MKTRIIIDEDNEEEIVIKCKKMTKDIESLHEIIKNTVNNSNQIVFYKDNTEYYFDLDNIIFFETNGNIVNAHTLNDIFEVKYKLYELENILPGFFTRISKSTIVNINKIYSINKNITSSSVIEFHHSYKQVYVSRMYYKPLKEKMKGRR